MFCGEPLVSIGMAVYNGEPYLHQAIGTFLDQTYQQFEIVIVDNASSDNTKAICLEYCAKDSRIRYYRNDSNIGVHANYRRVLALSKGEYFTWAGVDDIRPSNVLEICVKALIRNKRAVMVHGPVLSKGKGSVRLETIANQTDLSHNSPGLRIASFIQGIEHNAILYGLYRREAVVKATFGDCLGHDYLVGLQMCLLGPVEYVRAPIIVCQERRSTRTDNPMYINGPITLIDVLRGAGSRKKKCWTVLLMGLFYFAKIRGIALSERVSGLGAHLLTFTFVYRKQLLKELVLQALTPITWLSLIIWRTTRAWRCTQRLHAKLKQV